MFTKVKSSLLFLPLLLALLACLLLSRKPKARLSSQAQAVCMYHLKA
jgi:hypothetical protein